MSTTMTEGDALVILPPAANGRIGSRNLRRWLSCGELSFQPSKREVLVTALSAIQAPAPTSGFAALRFWGQTGERPAGWMAAADPVHLETRLRDLRVRALLPEQLPADDVRMLFESIQGTLGSDGQFTFEGVGHCGYLSGVHGVSFPDVSASIAAGHVPDHFMPDDDSRATYHRLIGELEMLLHEHKVNLNRQTTGLPIINSLWLWGGGVALPPAERRLPALFSNDDLFRGYWRSCQAPMTFWEGDLDRCLEPSTNGFVAVVPELHQEVASSVLEDYLSRLSEHMKRGNIKKLMILCRDGLAVRIQRRHRMRFWRGVSPFLAGQSNDE